MVLRLLSGETFQAFSTSLWTGYVISDGVDSALVGPTIEDIVAHAEGSNFSSKFKYKVVLEYRYVGKSWTAAGDLISATTSDAYTIGSVFSDRTKLGVQLRVVLYTQADTGGESGEQGDLNVTLAVRYFT